MYAMRQVSTALLIAGGGLGGVAAALVAARSGVPTVLTESTNWLGGVLTSQAVPPDEHLWIEQFGSTATYRRFRAEIRRYYRDHFPLTPQARDEVRLNPGAAKVRGCVTSRGCPWRSSTPCWRRCGAPECCAC